MSVPKTSPDIEQQIQHYLNHSQPYIVHRAEIVLSTLAGKDTATIAEETSLTPKTVQKWQEAWATDGLAIFPDNGGTNDSAEASPSALPDSVADSTTDELVIAPRDPMWEAARKSLLKQLYVMQHHVPLAVEGVDPEGVHKIRVASRTMGSILTLCDTYLANKPYKLMEKRIRKTRRTLGAVRDLDVIRLKTETYIATQLDGDAGALKSLLKYITAQRETAGAAMLDWLQSKKFNSFMDYYIDFLATPNVGAKRKFLDHSTGPIVYRVGQVVPRLIYEHLESIRAYEFVLDTAPPSILHELRIEFKRFRYTLDFFWDVLGPDRKVVMKATKKMQDHLGDLNDAVVAVAWLDKARGELPKRKRKAVDTYRDFRLAERQTLRDTFGEAWQAFNRQEVRQALALAVSDL